MSHSMSIVKRTQLAGLVLLGCMSLAIAAEKLAELSDDFLEYLGSMEGDDETWLDFAAETVVSRDTDTQQNSTQNSIKASKANVGSSSSSAASPPANPATRANTSAVSKTTGKAEQ